jgi:DNA-binding response OmpR family regulator
MVKKNILIIEDEIITAMSLQHLLELWGYRMCGQASSGKEAVEIAINEKPDIVLVDVSLSGDINGIEVARQIRSCFSIPIIFMTGYSDEETMEAIKEIEPAGCFVKPLDFNKLRTTLDSIVQKSKKNLRTKKR